MCGVAFDVGKQQKKKKEEGKKIGHSTPFEKLIRGAPKADLTDDSARVRPAHRQRIGSYGPRRRARRELARLCEAGLPGVRPGPEPRR